MNNLFDLINLAAQKPELVKSLASQFGLSEQQTENASQMLMSAVAGGLMNNIQKGGAESLMAALEKGNHENLLNKTKIEGENLFNVVQEGNNILGHILGSKEVSRQVAGAVEQKTDIDAQILKTMLPIIAAVVMGLLSQSMKQQGSNQFAGNIMSLIDMNKDGSPIDDILRIIGTTR